MASTDQTMTKKGQTCVPKGVARYSHDRPLSRSYLTPKGTAGMAEQAKPHQDQTTPFDGMDSILAAWYKGRSLTHGDGMNDKLVEQRKQRFLANGGAHGVYLAALEDEKLKGRLNVSPSGSLRYQGQPMGAVGMASILVYLTGKYGLKPTEFELRCGLISAAEKGLSVSAAEPHRAGVDRTQAPQGVAGREQRGGSLRHGRRCQGSPAG